MAAKFSVPMYGIAHPSTTMMLVRLEKVSEKASEYPAVVVIH